MRDLACFENSGALSDSACRVWGLEFRFWSPGFVVWGLQVAAVDGDNSFMKQGGRKIALGIHFLFAAPLSRLRLRSGCRGRFSSLFASCSCCLRLLLSPVAVHFSLGSICMRIPAATAVASGLPLYFVEAAQQHCTGRLKQDSSSSSIRSNSCYRFGAVR